MWVGVGVFVCVWRGGGVCVCVCVCVSVCVCVCVCECMCVWVYLQCESSVKKECAWCVLNTCRYVVALISSLSPTHQLRLKNENQFLKSSQSLV